jgi:dCMP deaminase
VKQLMLYIPVIHSGYEALLDRHTDATEILLLGQSFADSYPTMRKEIRALTPSAAARYIRGRPRSPAVRVIETGDLPSAITAETLIAADEDIIRDLLQVYELGKERQIIIERTFLRWDKDWSLAQRPVDYHGAICRDQFKTRMLFRAAEVATRSSDWWRQVGALAARDDRLIGIEYNHHLPTEYSPYMNGDPRNNFRRGVHSDLSTAIHAEAALVARAARFGTSLASADLYVTTFPCPPCARLVAEAGFRSCFFSGPYATLDGDAVMRSSGMELFWVDFGDLS